MYGSLRFNFLFASFGFILYFILSFSITFLLRTTIYSFISFIVFFVFAFLVRYLLNLSLKEMSPAIKNSNGIITKTFETDSSLDLEQILNELQEEEVEKLSSYVKDLIKE